MSFQIVTEPIAEWPLPETKARPFPRFTAAYRQTEQLLPRELEALGARGAVVVQVVTRNGAADLRRDGALRAQAKIEHPGVRLSFESKHGPLTYATDAYGGTYQRPAWQQNLRAIALGLEALRAVDRYGVSRSGEQYRGWQQLAAPRTAAASGMSRDVARSVLAEEAGNAGLGLPLGDKLVRLARFNAHPDRNNGDQRRWNALMDALATLGLSD